MVETASHLNDQVFPQVPVCQWVLPFPKRPRYFLARDADLFNRVLRIFLNSVEKVLLLCYRDAPDHARRGAVTFVHRFGIEWKHPFPLLRHRWWSPWCLKDATLPLYPCPSPRLFPSAHK